MAGCGSSTGTSTSPAPRTSNTTKAVPTAGRPIKDDATPCFPGPPLVASTVFSHVDKFGTGMHVYDGKMPLPNGHYGSCSIKKGALWSANDELVAHINCGLSVKSPGLVDHLGLGIGARGSDVVAREQHGVKRFICVNQDAKSLCWFISKTQNEEPWVKYTVAAKLPAQSLRGKAAATFFAKHTVSAFHVTMYCH